MNKRSMLKAALAATATATVACARLAAAAAAPARRSFKFVTQNPKGHPIVIGMEAFAERVARRSDGRLECRLYPGGTLGNDAQNVSAMQGGTIEMASLNSGILASHVRDFEVYDYPFLFGSTHEADAVVDGPFGRNLHALLEPKGLVGLGYWELGFRNVTNRVRPIHRIEDMQGLKLRVIPNAINLEWVKAVGANPTPLPWPEVYAALDQRAIDGQENPLTVISANRFYEVQKHLAITNHVYNPQSLLVSRRFWDSLGEADRRVLQESAAEAIPLQRRASREQSAGALDELRRHGMEVTQLSVSELDRFRERVRPVVERQAEPIRQTLQSLQAALAQQRR